MSAASPTPETGGTSRYPDPTVLTTQQLIRELSSLREILEARMNGADKFIDRIQHDVDRRQLAIDAKVSQLQELHTEKFDSVQTQFKERDTRTDQAASTTKVAVDAALQAQKEAVGEQNKSSALAIAKSEAATTKQIDQIGALIQITTNGFNDKIEDLKTRLALTEGRSSGANWLWGVIAGGIGILMTIVGLIFTFMSRK